MQRNTIIRLVLLMLVMGAFAALLKYTPLGSFFDFKNLQTIMLDAGFTGMLIFLAGFGVGTIMNIPGFIFMIPAILVYGYMLGVPLAYFGGVFSVAMHFLVIRIIGGKALGEIEQPFIKKMLSKLEDSPIQTVVILRILLFVSPPVNYALALSNLTFRDFMIGTLIGMILPLAFLVLLIYFAQDLVINWLS